MVRPPQRRRSLMPLIVLLAALLAVSLVGLMVVRSGDDPEDRSADRTALRAATQATVPTRTAPARTTPGDPAKQRAEQRAGWPVRGAAATRARVPILMYHVIGDVPAGAAYPDLWVAPDRFAAQVEALRAAGFTAITMEELWSAWHDGGRLPERPVVLSFDDGDITHAMNAAPVLLKVGWPGVLNLTVQNLGKRGLPMWGAKRLIRQGWEIGSHTVTHPDVTTLDAAGFARELAGSRKTIKQRLGVDVRFFCYPAGKSDAASRAAVAAAGYLAATTVDPGLAARADDPYLLPRVRVDPSTTPAALVRMARGG
ncbi:MAG: polysaccharide deacetylase family protein [Patulibacter sp.]|nr:polysaccharide deacetylase family protein [Patulibacter sp.]